MQPYLFIVITMEYLPFDSFILRTPASSFMQDDLKELNHQKIVDLFNKDFFFKEAIFTASQTLYHETCKSLAQDKIEKKIMESLAKYYIRYKTRCTPFGMFAGCTWGTIGKETEIILNSSQHYKKNIRLDMELVSKLTHYFSSLPEVQRQIKFYPNNTLFLLTDFYSYIEFSTVNKKKNYFKTITEYNEYLASVLDVCEKGKFINEIVDFLTDNGFDKEDSEEYIMSLIENQILVSDLEISTTDTDPFKTLLSKLSDLYLEENSFLIRFMKDSKALIDSFSKDMTTDYIPNIQDSKAVFEFIEHDAHNIFQLDLQMNTKSCVLAEKTVRKISRSINVIKKFSPCSEEDPLNEFKKRFQNRYESEEVSLLEVLDEDFGLGYPILEEKLVAPLLDKIKFPRRAAENNLTWNKRDSLLSQKLSEFFLENLQNIEIQDHDLDLIADDSTGNLPDTLSALVEIYKKGDQEIIYIPNLIASGAKLLGRFSYFDQDMENMTKNIIKKEMENREDVIIAEIVHLPEFREGNVILRPRLTDYEIPILSRSHISEEFQIPLKDLVVSIKKDELVLRSLRLNKRIIPRLSSAHFAGNPKNLSFYKFLADLQYQNIRKNLFFDWGIMGKEFKYLPRVVYKDIILSKAYWNISEKDIEYLTELSRFGEEVHQRVNEWRDRNRVPSVVCIKDMDNKLYIDFNNELLLSLFLNEVKKHHQLILEEVIFDNNNLFVKNENGELFTNEFIVNFYKNGGQKSI